jgi:hypothetical protein
MHQQKPAGIATEREVKEKLQEMMGALQGKDPYHPDVESAVNDFLSKIRQHTGLFVERAPKRYGFMHLTFEEYFAARWLVARPLEAARRIRNKLHRPRWEEPILLAIAHYGMEFPDDVSDLVEEAVLGEGLGGPSPYENILHPEPLFAVRVMGNQDLRVEMQNGLLGRFVDLWVERDNGGKYGALQERAKRFAAALSGSTAYTIVMGLLMTALNDENAGVRSRAASALSSAMEQEGVVTALLLALQDESKKITIREDLLAALLAGAPPPLVQ